jgi:hypothetical protein
VSRRLYLSSCSREKADHLAGTDEVAPPDVLYTEPGLVAFIQRCRDAGVAWGVLSDMFGVIRSTDERPWYAKAPDSVTPEEVALAASVAAALSDVDEVRFFVRDPNLHPLYRRLLEQPAVAARIVWLEDLDPIE